MPLEQGERRTDYPLERQPCPGGRWCALRSARGSPHIGSAGGAGLAQAQSATPSAGQTVESQSELNLPSGITSRGGR